MVSYISTTFPRLVSIKGLTNSWLVSYTCKARHASCDEKKPVCSNCERLSLHCRPFEFIVRSAWCPTTPTVDEEPIAEASTAATNISSGNDGDSVPASSPGTSRRAESVPSVFSSTNEFTAPSSMSSTTTSSPSSAASPPVAVKPLTLPLTSEMAHLLSVYATGVATWMDIFDHTRSYQCEVLRRCLTSALLTKCVCAFTAKQLSLIPSGGDLWAAPAARYYGDALRLLIQHLDSSPGSAKGDALTANMLLSSYEMLEAHSHEHQRHLRGASALIRMQGIDAQCQGMDRANFWIYVRHEITIALENETALQLSPSEWNVEWQRGLDDEDALGNQLLWLVARAIDIVHGPDHHPPLEAALQELHVETAGWFDNLPVSFQGVKYGPTDDLGFTKTYFAIPAAGKLTTNALLYANGR
jgi:hypothetical protein